MERNNSSPLDNQKENFMQITDRIFKGFISLLAILSFWIIGMFFNKIYPTFRNSISIIDLPSISGDFFILISLFIAVYLLISWSIRNQIWKGIQFSIEHYLIIKNIRKHLSQASFQESHLKRRYITLPKIKIEFDDKKVRNTGKIVIQNSIQFDQKLENLRIDSAIKQYVCERQYLSADRNWYTYEFYSAKSQQQIEFKIKEDYLAWCHATSNDYSIRLDSRTTVPIHHAAFSGHTGAGKSFFLQMLLDQLNSKSVEHELYITDPKRADVYYKTRKYSSKYHVSDKEGAIQLIENFYQRMLERQHELQSFFENNPNKTYEDAELPALILLIDEYGALRSSWNTLSKKERDEVEANIAEIAFMGRQLGCFLWITTQQMNAQTVPTAIREQLILKVVLGDSDEQTYRTLFSSSVKVPPIEYKTGIGLYAYPSLANVDKPRLLMVPFCSYLEYQ